MNDETAVLALKAFAARGVFVRFSDACVRFPLAAKIFPLSAES